MKALILATDIYTRGGIARYTATLATALGELLGPENVDLLPLLDDSERRFTPTEYRILKATTSKLTVFTKVGHAGRALAQAASHYNLVICSHVSLAPIAALIRRSYGKPYFVVCYGSEVWDRLPLVKRVALRGASLVLADSRFTAGAAARANRVPEWKIRLLLNAIPEELVRRLVGPQSDGAPGSPQEPGPLLLSVGSLSTVHAYKGVDMVIRALPHIVQAAPGTRYMVVGDGDNRPNLERLAVRCGVAGRVTFAREVSDAELARHYRACEVFVLPSRASQRREDRKLVTEGEGFGRVYVEAAMAGKPVVGSRDGGAAEAVLDGQTGLLVDPRCADEIADAVISLLKAPKRATAMGAEGRRWAVENFTIEAMRRSLENILSSLVLCRSSVLCCSVPVVRSS